MYKQAGAILIANDDEYVLVKSRSKDHFVFPKGTIKANEDAESAAKREAIEEAGAIALSIGAKHGVNETIWYEFRGLTLLKEYAEKTERERIIVTFSEAKTMNVSRNALKLMSLVSKHMDIV